MTTDPQSPTPDVNETPSDAPVSTSEGAVATPANSNPAAGEPAAGNPADGGHAGSEVSEQASTHAGARPAGPLAARGLGVAKPASPSVSSEQLEKTERSGTGKSKKKKPPRPRLGGEREPAAASKDDSKVDAPKPKTAPGRVAVPSIRGPLGDDLEAELEAELGAADVESMLGGRAGMPDRREPLAEGTRMVCRVIKIHQDSVYVGLGGPDEGVVPFEQFETEPAVGAMVEVMVRGFNGDDGLYVCTLPGAAIDVADWTDLEEGAVVEAVVTGHNTGGLECKVGAVRAFMPISQITEYRVEDLSEFVDQKFLCLVTEANERRGNLVLSRRAILEREREEKRAEQLQKIEAGDVVEGIVQSVKDFGAFVDLGALQGLIHVSKLSWDRIKHPSEVLEVGQKVSVKIERIDKESGKIGLSYRDMLENPWDSAEAEFAIGTVHRGTVSKIASFGAFVRPAAGIEGLVHVSELAHHRVSKIDAFVSEGQEVEVKVLSFDRDSQKIGLSMKAAQKVADDSKPVKEEVEEPPREVAVKPTHEGPLRGGNNRDTGGEKFGLRW